MDVVLVINKSQCYSDRQNDIFQKVAFQPLKGDLLQCKR